MVGQTAQQSTGQSPLGMRLRTRGSHRARRCEDRLAGAAGGTRLGNTNIDTILDEKEMKKAQTFLKRKITSKRQEYLEQDRKKQRQEGQSAKQKLEKASVYYQIYKDDVIKQEPKANKEFCKIVQELAQKSSEMPPIFVGDLRASWNEVPCWSFAFEAGGCGQRTN